MEVPASIIINAVQSELSKGLSRAEVFGKFLDGIPTIQGKTAEEVAIQLEQMDLTDFLRVLVSLIRRQMRRPSRKRLPQYSSIDRIVELIKTRRKILVLTGAGVSTSCGIPDFRSANGVYSMLGDYPLDDPQDLFSISYFKRNVKPFYDFARKLWPGTHKPAPTHRFIQNIEQNGHLLRNYTQNIDTLEYVTGIKKVLQCHGSFATATCTRCKFKCPGDDIKDDILGGRIPLCPKCAVTPMPSLTLEYAMGVPDIKAFRLTGHRETDIHSMSSTGSGNDSPVAASQNSLSKRDHSSSIDSHASLSSKPGNTTEKSTAPLDSNHNSQNSGEFFRVPSLQSLGSINDAPQALHSPFSAAAAAAASSAPTFVRESSMGNDATFGKVNAPEELKQVTKAISPENNTPIKRNHGTLEEPAAKKIRKDDQHIPITPSNTTQSSNQIKGMEKAAQSNVGAVPNDQTNGMNKPEAMNAHPDFGAVSNDQTNGRNKPEAMNAHPDVGAVSNEKVSAASNVPVSKPTKANDESESHPHSSNVEQYPERTVSNKFVKPSAGPKIVSKGKPASINYQTNHKTTLSDSEEGTPHNSGESSKMATPNRDPNLDSKTTPRKQRANSEASINSEGPKTASLPFIDEMFDRGIMKPDIVFFGEQLPSDFFDCIETDVKECDLLIVMGTSLKVAPVSHVIEMLDEDVPQILINREVVAAPHQFDIELLGNCDQVSLALSKKLGWDVQRNSTFDGVDEMPKYTRCEPEVQRYLFEGAMPPFDSEDEMSEEENNQNTEKNSSDSQTTGITEDNTKAISDGDNEMKGDGCEKTESEVSTDHIKAPEISSAAVANADLVVNTDTKKDESSK